ncbi:parathyroid hormone 2 receptor [Octodon degus]|uniref:Parathyroid hormone 2 receptor n=1 Tax=Octodon degus TaxID=10160 RepID=A0A6P3EL11_OCTDE|nr:parathyroid hormone 2 receptor [Octodon degus]
MGRRHTPAGAHAAWRSGPGANQRVPGLGPGRAAADPRAPARKPLLGSAAQESLGSGSERMDHWLSPVPRLVALKQRVERRKMRLSVPLGCLENGMVAAFLLLIPFRGNDCLPRHAPGDLLSDALGCLHWYACKESGRALWQSCKGKSLLHTSVVCEDLDAVEEIHDLDSDGVITIEEQIILLKKAKVQCEQNITAQHQEGGNCSPEWDGLICWPRGTLGKISTVPCPSYIYDFNHKGAAFRHCTLNGTWDFIHSLNKTWANYSDCFLQQDIINTGKQEFFESLYILYTVGYSISFGSLAVAILIIGYFRRLHCTRNYIHLHLFVSFMLRAVSIFIKDKVVQAHLRIGELQSLMVQDDLQSSFGVPSVDKSQYIWCKIAVVMFIYFLATNYYWILVEGLYLHNLIFVSFFSDTKYLWGFIWIGWGFPAAFVVAWSVARATLADTRCWELSAGDRWIYQAPILAAIGLNFILFLNTVRVLATKIWETNTVGHDMRKQYRKLAKSTLVLILVFGVHYIVFICQPHSFTGLWWEIRMHCELFFNSFQGFFVSIVYCYCNGEVQAEVKKMWSRWNLSIDWKRTAPCGSHRYGSVFTTVTHSTSSQSHMAASTRMVLISGKPKTASRLPDSHVTLPGCVWSNSEQDCLPHSILKETKDHRRLEADMLVVEESCRPLKFTLEAEECKGETEDVI